MSNVNLSKKAVLVTMIVSQYLAKGRSKEVDAKVTAHLKTKRKAGSTQIDLLDPKEVAHTKRAAYNIRKHFNRMTLPWDEKSRILPSALYDQFQEKHKILVREFSNRVDEFAIAFPSLLRKAENELGEELYNLMEFPAITEIRSKFGVMLSYNPVPVSGDFRITLSNDEIDNIRQELDERNKAMLSRSMHDAWRRLHTVVQEMTEKINKPTFRDSIVGNITDLVNILPGLNLGEDTELDRVREEVIERLCRYTPSELRNNSSKRSEIEIAAREIVGSMRKLRTDL